MRRKISDLPEITDLPDLTEQQRNFVAGVLAGKNSSDAYRAAYDCSNSQPNSIWTNASQLRSDAKVALWIAAARKAGLGNATVTLADHVNELARLKELALEAGNHGAAVQAEQLRGKAMGHYTERLEVTDLTDITKEIRELEKISPELAELYARQKGVQLH